MTTEIITSFQRLCVESYTDGRITEQHIADAAVMFPREAPLPSVAHQISVERQIMRSCRINVRGYVRRFRRLREEYRTALGRHAHIEIINDALDDMSRTETLIAEHRKEHHECAIRLRALTV